MAPSCVLRRAFIIRPTEFPNQLTQINFTVTLLSILSVTRTSPNVIASSYQGMRRPLQSTFLTFELSFKLAGAPTARAQKLKFLTVWAGLRTKGNGCPNFVSPTEYQESFYQSTSDASLLTLASASRAFCSSPGNQLTSAMCRAYCFIKLYFFPRGAKVRGGFLWRWIGQAHWSIYFIEAFFKISHTLGSSFKSTEFSSEVSLMRDLMFSWSSLSE